MSVKAELVPHPVLPVENTISTLYVEFLHMAQVGVPASGQMQLNLAPSLPSTCFGTLGKLLCVSRPLCLHL